MVRGVSREIIEISDTGNNYFEKALLYVRPGVTPEESKYLSDEGKKFLSSIGGVQGSYQKAPKVKMPIGLILSALAGSFATYLFMILK